MFEIIYDYGDETGISELYEGTWSDLKVYIKQMRSAGCYNITATQVN